MENNQEQEELTREQRLEIEDKALQALLNMGCKFSVPLKIYPVKPSKWYNFLKRTFPKRTKVWHDKRIPKGWNVSVVEIPDVETERMKEVYMRHFNVKPLYLGTIDRLRQMYIGIEYDEKTIQEQPIQETKRLFKYTKQMADIAAVAVINDPTVAEKESKAVKELSKFFMEHLTVTRLQKLTAIISQMMNPAGFTTSIRLIREVGTTKPNPKAQRIE
nr:MAG TPA: hypothetical protein [Caudoviricetes sp.]